MTAAALVLIVDITTNAVEPLAGSYSLENTAAPYADSCLSTARTLQSTDTKE